MHKTMFHIKQLEDALNTMIIKKKIGDTGNLRYKKISAVECQVELTHFFDEI